MIHRIYAMMLAEKIFFWTMLFSSYVICAWLGDLQNWESIIVDQDRQQDTQTSLYNSLTTTKTTYAQFV